MKVTVKIQPLEGTEASSTRLFWCYPGGITLDHVIPGNGGEHSFHVPEGVSGEAWANYRDKHAIPSRDTGKVQFSKDKHTITVGMHIEDEVKPVKHAKPLRKIIGKAEEIPEGWRLVATHQDGKQVVEQIDV